MGPSTDGFPELEVTYSRRVARVMRAIAVGLSACFLVGLALLIVLWGSAHAPDAENATWAKCVRGAPFGIVICGTLGGMLFFEGRGKWRRAFQWHGSTVTMGPSGLTIRRPDGCAEIAWKDVARVAVRYAHGVVALREPYAAYGEEAGGSPARRLVVEVDGRPATPIASHPIAVSGVRFGRKRMRYSASWALPVVARAYWHASRVGLELALEEPPRVLTGYLRPSREQLRREVWQEGVPWALFLAIPGSMTYMCFKEQGLADGLSAVGMGAALLALMVWVGVGKLRMRLWNRVRMDRRGIAVRTVKGQRLIPWHEVQDLSVEGRSLRGVVTTGGETVLLRFPGPLLEANLSALARGTASPESDILVETARHYLPPVRA
ncbi:MAG TPA: PH domain-containing protein [Armatimonadota bacterium]|nr:PH domain-containing protein [Armatimonadota bacterium]